MQIIKYQKSDEDYYRAGLNLREEVLRKPLGKSLYQEDLTLEKDNDCYGILLEEQLVATLSCFDASANVAHVTAFAVAPFYQGQGLGKALVSFLKEELQAQGYTEIKVNARETAKRFYETCGFVAIGEPFKNQTLGIYDCVMHYQLKESIND
ncbi:GNAT family N-acetyltransferase [Vagococcus sp. BWB3-3]|uniref:GNAT family N-acetyltransferase n=1 Tax=Vagococcus allomyrinae TaxID=2794353 RepID=A0A940P7X1_9ENTE|nr:GNAT family N-acetyltransferase [Vagococcus allomyrinae]